MKSVLALFLVMTQMTVVMSPAFADFTTAPADSSTTSQIVQKRLRSFRQARVLVDGDWLLVQSPMATPQGLRFDGIIESKSSTIGDPTSLSWERVSGIQVEVSGAGWGAVSGGLIVGAATGVMAGVLSAEAGMFPSYEPDPTAVVAGALMGFAAGAVVGAIIGSGFKRWARVYP